MRAERPSDCWALEGQVRWRTDMASCDEAMAYGTEQVVDLGLADDPDSTRAQLVVGMTCAAMQGGPPVTPSPEAAGLGRRLHASGMCPGDPTLVRSGR